MPIEIMPFEPHNLEQVSKIEEQSFTDPWPQELFTVLSKRPSVTFLVGVGSGTVQGYAVGQLDASIHPRNGHLIKRSGHILNIAVSRESRRTGVGTLLMNEIERRLREKSAQTIRLEVRASNTQAQHFYTKLGYRHTETVRLYYGDEDAYIMQKTLQ